MLLRVIALCAAIVLTSGTVSQSDAQEQESPQAKLIQLAEENRYRLEYDGETFSGSAWNKLIAEGEKVQFFLLGEEHGIAENPKLAGALFSKLTDAGYSKVAIEVSPIVARNLDETLRDEGLEGLKRLYSRVGGEPAFFGMKEEAEFLQTVRSAVKGKAPVLWGADYEVGSDRVLLDLLEAKRKPEEASEVLASLRAASDESWAKYYETQGPQFIFSFSGDPALVRTLRDSWPRRDDETDWILDTLEETLEINKHWVNGEGWRSNERRANFLRANFLRHWAAEKRKNGSPKVFAKFGASHLMRGLNATETFDLGSLLPELAEIEGGHAFSIIVLPGDGSNTAVLDPRTFTYVSAPAKDGYARGLGAVSSAAYEDAFTLIDMRPLRSELSSGANWAPKELRKVVHSYDMMLVMSGSTPSSPFAHEPPDPSVLRPDQ
ncbi:hypothetical protein PUV54_13055 [Hyphococcus flavus]|uniref:Erythromycin esterase n=1 Tax=Hyphococcus flavus TaxID=1866326 RepID=A0AAF0CFG5_9PROT|nr:hypothetical protein [Hyphococcus flavus]WDI30883.1 hypothetical protein PUV54_13055 [Hyphococcus flavus]